MDSFFSLSKLFWFLAAPDHLLVWLMLLGLVLRWLGKRRLAGWLLSIDLLLLMGVLLMPLGDIVLHPLESRFQQPDLNKIEPAGIVILGGGENNLDSSSGMNQEPAKKENLDQTVEDDDLPF